MDASSKADEFPTSAGEESHETSHGPDSEPPSTSLNALTINEPPQQASADRQIILNVGGRHFVTSPDTLSGSSYFKALLSERWKTQDDGSYFVDADPELFEHVLRYPRHKTVPLFYDRSKGHNIGMYMALLQVADYLGVEELIKYLRDKWYFQMVTMRVTTEEVDHPYYTTEEMQTNVEVEYQSACTTRKVYVCPRGIAVHMESPASCGNDCRKRSKEWVNDYEDRIVQKLVRIKREVFVSQEVWEYMYGSR
ncbi:MAG: hypothetical protein Q9160_004477 [Pyrenula sp. 1 TL-2023]